MRGTQTETPTATSLAWDFGELASIQVRCPVLHFRLMDPRPYLRSHNVVALAMAALMKLDDVQQVDVTVDSLAECLRQGLAPEDLGSVLEFVSAYVKLREDQCLQMERRVHTLSRKYKHLRTMPKLINPFVQLGEIKGHKKGMQQGRAEGMQQGMQQGEHAVISRLLQRKFPTVSKRAAPLLRKLDEEGLLSFGEALLFMDSPAQCFAWLQRRV